MSQVKVDQFATRRARCLLVNHTEARKVQQVNLLHYVRILIAYLNS